MSGKLGLVGNFASEWIRYSSYEYKENESGELYIVPADEATFELFNPFDVADIIVVDILQIGEYALSGDKDESKETNLKYMILEFCEKYGLLGLAYSSVYNRNIVDEDKVLMVEKNYITKESILDATEYINKFLPFIKDEDLYFRKFKRGVDVKKSEDSPKFFGKRPLILDVIFSKFYAERYNWILSFAKDIARHFRQMLVYSSSSNHLTDAVTIISGGFNPQKIGFSITYLDKANIAWEFDSLKTTIETIYAFAITGENSHLNKCKYCGKIFIPSRAKSQYCSPSCRNCANVNKSRQRKSLETKKLNK